MLGIWDGREHLTTPEDFILALYHQQMDREEKLQDMA